MTAVNGGTAAAPAVDGSSASQLDRDLYCLRSAGFLVLRRYLPEDVVDRIHRSAMAFEREVAQFRAEGGEVILTHSWPLQTTRCLYVVSTDVQDFAMDARLQSIVRGYLGEPILRDCLLQTNMPDPRNASRGLKADVSYHRDTLWTEATEPAPMYLHAFLLLTDCTAENGATLAVPGSHRAREPGYYFKHSDPREPQAGIAYRVYEREYFGSAVHLEAPRGSVVLLDPMLIHTQGNNITPHGRSLLNVAFRAAHVKGQPALLNARKIATLHARVPVRPDFLALLENDENLPAHFGPLTCHGSSAAQGS